MSPELTELYKWFKDALLREAALKKDTSDIQAVVDDLNTHLE